MYKTLLACATTAIVTAYFTDKTAMLKYANEMKEFAEKHASLAKTSSELAESFTRLQNENVKLFQFLHDQGGRELVQEFNASVAAKNN